MPRAAISASLCAWRMSGRSSSGPGAQDLSHRLLDLDQRHGRRDRVGLAGAEREPERLAGLAQGLVAAHQRGARRGDVLLDAQHVEVRGGAEPLLATEQRQALERGPQAGAVDLGDPLGDDDADDAADDPGEHGAPLVRHAQLRRRDPHPRGPDPVPGPGREDRLRDRELPLDRRVRARRHAGRWIRGQELLRQRAEGGHGRQRERERLAGVAAGALHLLDRDPEVDRPRADERDRRAPARQLVRRGRDGREQRIVDAHLGDGPWRRRLGLGERDARGRERGHQRDDEGDESNHGDRASWPCATHGAARRSG